ncbi:MAG: transposase [Bacillota bacterium]|nr:transposase [Bacillota bacterium]
MPRHARKESASKMYHVIFRGINKQDIFLDDEDRRKFLMVLLIVKELCGFELYSYCLMSNHVHLLIGGVDKQQLAEIIKRISASYVYWFNKKYNRCGHLFQERFRSEPVDNTSYFLTVIRYILQNPVKAGLVARAADFPWSSYHEFKNDSPVISDTDFVLGLFAENKREALQTFIQFINLPNEDACLEYEEKRGLSDDEIITCIKRLGLEFPGELKRQEVSRRNFIIKSLNIMNGVSVRQIARVTGLSKSTIERTLAK